MPLKYSSSRFSTIAFTAMVIVSVTLGSLSVCAQNGADSLLQFIQQNKSKSSLYLQKNGLAIASLNENKMMPLASTVKIMIAVEFAKQAASKLFNTDQYVSLNELNKYYLANTDGNSHPNWLAYEKNLGNVKNDSVKLIEVARGMIMFSSNANSEYLMDLLGFENVKSNIPLFGIKNHSTIYPLPASLFVYQNPKSVDEDKILKEIKKLPEDQYFKYIFAIHNQLKYDSNYKKQFRLQDLSMKMQKAWSDRLPASTTREYVRLCQVINYRSYLGGNAFNVLSHVLESVMENPLNQGLFTHAGMKGGSTPFVLTKALYATLKDGTKIELAYFFNDLDLVTNTKLQGWMNDFELKILTDSSFRDKVKF